MDADSAATGVVKRFLGSLEGEHTLERVSDLRNGRGSEADVRSDALVSGLMGDASIQPGFRCPRQSEGDDGNSASFTGQSTCKLFKPSRGKAGLIRLPRDRPCAFLAHGSRAPVGARLPAPSSTGEGQGAEQSSGKTCRENESHVRFVVQIFSPPGCFGGRHRNDF